MFVNSELNIVECRVQILRNYRKLNIHFGQPLKPKDFIQFRNKSSLNLRSYFFCFFFDLLLQTWSFNFCPRFVTSFFCCLFGFSSNFSNYLEYWFCFVFFRFIKSELFFLFYFFRSSFKTSLNNLS